MKKHKNLFEVLACMQTINIIGAGPAGCFVAGELAKSFKVNVYEEHSEIGQPVHCTGIVTAEITRIVRLPESVVLDRISSFAVNCRGSSLVLSLKNPDVVVDREKFEKFLYEQAVSAGAEFFLGCRLEKITKEFIFLRKKGRLVKKPRGILVGADGPASLVSRYLGNSNRFFFGMQALGRPIEQGKVEVALGIGKFCWKVPCGGLSKIGVMSEIKDVKSDFALLDKQGCCGVQAGLIPVYNPREVLSKDGVYVIGDAASFVKATTGGGLVQGLLSAKILAHCLRAGKSYEKGVRPVKRELLAHLFARRLLDNTGADGLERLVAVLSKPCNKAVLSGVSRDELPSLALSLFLRNPFQLAGIFLPALVRYIFIDKNL